MLHSRFLGGLFSVPMLFGLATAASAASFNGIPIPEAPSFGAPLPTGDDFGGFFVTARVAGVDQSGFSPNVSALVDKTGNGLGSGYSPSWKSSLGVGVSGEMGYNFRYGQWAFGPSLVIGTQFDDASLSGSYNWLGVGPFQRYLSTTARANLGYVITSRLMLYGFVGAGIDAANYGFNSNRQDRAFGAVDAAPAWLCEVGADEEVGAEDRILP